VKKSIETALNTASSRQNERTLIIAYRGDREFVLEKTLLVFISAISKGLELGID
jgi:glycerophosphoryl diester phosphodiesterase